ncbi:MAG: hypothetical protein OXT74_05735 [Candidatus Poribacteria bacterium]|nr:hypothetical protein [Candidatus Poribacteria bacterium]
MPGAFCLGLFFVLFFSWHGFTQWQTILGNPVGFGRAVRGTKLFVPTYVLESDAIMSLNVYDGFYPRDPFRPIN